MSKQQLSDEDIQPISESGLSESFASPSNKPNYTDERPLWEWRSKYPDPARLQINIEAWILVILLVISSILSAALLSLSGQEMKLPILVGFFTESTDPRIELHIDFKLMAIFVVGMLGGVTFSAKWLIHSVAKGKWHLDRRYWRLMVPLMGGVYACVVLALLDGGIIGGQPAGQPHSMAVTAAFAFLVGYFSDGVGGLLSNIANAVFGTLEKK